MRRREGEGRIISFYSFKGGVGRTMALANVAYLVSQNNYRVLVMDWDLEAPGLPYYFRGLMEGTELKQLKEAPGILNLIWQWRSLIGESKTQRQIDDLFDKLENGDHFASLVQSVGELDTLGSRGCLDYIGAGSPLIGNDNPLSYEEALAHFSWPEFFENYTGGALLQGLRDWAKQNYDFIFIDSRTGMADVAGVCTMQIPDVVALCFVLNRQNIDGVAKVASAIRAKRDNQVDLRAVPMRLRSGGIGASLETDAQARAQLQLTKIGGFAADSLSDDFKQLSVTTALELPYYETLAPFLAADPSLDYLTLNYLRLATQLLNVELEIPDFDAEWMEVVQRRLQPTHATIDYVLRLKSSEASRAVEELSRLIESAFEDEIDGADLDDDYVSALIETAIGLTDYSDSPFEALEMLNRAMDLLRDLTVKRPDKWKALLISALARCLSDLNVFLEPNEELALLEELDGLLSAGTTLNVKLQRIANRRRVARLYANENEVESANQTLGDLNRLIKEFKEAASVLKLSVEQSEEILAADVEMSVIRGDIQQQQESYFKSVHEYRAGLDKLLKNSSQGSFFRTELQRLRYDLYSRLARIGHNTVPIEEAADHALQAVRSVSWSGGTNAFIVHFIDLSRSVLAVENREKAYQFLDAAFGDERRGQLQFANYYGRQPRAASAFMEILTEFARRLSPAASERTYSLLRQITSLALQISSNLERRKHIVSDKSRSDVREQLRELLGIVEGAGVSVDLSPNTRLKRPRPE